MTEIDPGSYITPPALQGQSLGAMHLPFLSTVPFGQAQPSSCTGQCRGLTSHRLSQVLGQAVSQAVYSVQLSSLCGH